jgi:hypothetical protein
MHKTLIYLFIYLFIYLHIIHLLKSSTCFEHYSAHLQDVYVVIVYMQPLVSSLSAGLVHRLRKKSSFLTGAQDSHLQTMTIPEAAYIHLRRRPPKHSSSLTGAQDSRLQRVTIPEATYIQIRRRPPEDEQGNARNM